jgi:hypothetical protein
MVSYGGSHHKKVSVTYKSGAKKGSSNYGKKSGAASGSGGSSNPTTTKSQTPTKIDHGGFIVNQNGKKIAFKFKADGGIEKVGVVGGSGSTTTEVYSGTPTDQQLAQAKSQVTTKAIVEQQTTQPKTNMASIFGTQLPSDKFNARQSMHDNSYLRKEQTREKGTLERRREAIVDYYTRFKSGEKKLARVTTEKVGFLQPSINVAKKKAGATADAETYSKVGKELKKQGKTIESQTYMLKSKGAKVREFSYGFIQSAKNTIREKPATLLIEGIAGFGFGGLGQVAKKSRAAYKVYKYGSYGVAGVGVIGVGTKVASTPREDRGNVVGEVTPHVVAFGGGGYLGAKAYTSTSNTKVTGKGSQFSPDVKKYQFKGEVKGQSFKSKAWETPDATYEKASFGGETRFKKTAIEGITEYTIKNNKVVSKTYTPNTKIYTPKTPQGKTTTFKSKPETRLSYDPKKHVSTFEVAEFQTQSQVTSKPTSTRFRKKLETTSTSKSVLGKTTTKAKSQFEEAQLTEYVTKTKKVKGKTTTTTKVIGQYYKNRYTKPKFVLDQKSELGKSIHVAEDTPHGFLKYQKQPVKAEHVSMQKDVGYDFKYEYTDEFKGFSMFDNKMMKSKKGSFMLPETITTPQVGVKPTSPKISNEPSILTFDPMAKTLRITSNKPNLLIPPRKSPTATPQSPLTTFEPKLGVGTGKIKPIEKTNFKPITDQRPELKALITPNNKERIITGGRNRFRYDQPQDQKPKQKVDLIPDQDTTTKQDYQRRFTKKTNNDISPKIGVDFAPEIPPTFTFFGGIPSFTPFGGVGSGKRRKKIRVKQPRKYTPTGFAAIFNIKGKSTKGGIKSGLGIRPLTPVKKKKKKLNLRRNK